MNVVLIGYRGSGKSTVGKHLADQLSLSLVDIDHEIMARYDNRSVADIWATEGQPHFRNTECDVTEHVCQLDNQVIALGGGTPMQPRAFAALASAPHTTRFYLKAPAQTLHDRISSDNANTDNRPSLTAHDSGLAEVQHMLDQRQPTYEQLADHIIDVADQSPAQAAEQIARILSDASAE